MTLTVRCLLGPLGPLARENENDLTLHTSLFKGSLGVAISLRRLAYETRTLGP